MLWAHKEVFEKDTRPASPRRVIVEIERHACGLVVVEDQDRACISTFWSGAGRGKGEGGEKGFFGSLDFVSGVFVGSEFLDHGEDCGDICGAGVRDSFE